jgi:hypothetical protein
MARAKKTKDKDPSFRTMKADYYPVQRQINLRSSSTEVDYYVLDVGRNLSAMNHRLYRQGKTYSVKVDLDPGHVAATYDVYALVDTWYIQKAWQLARATYLQNMSEERGILTKGQVARWEDFRVDAGLSGHAGGELVPARFSNGLASAADTGGEFALTEMTLPDGSTTRTFTWSATAGTKLGILEEYDKTGDTQTTPQNTGGGRAYDGVNPGVGQGMDDLANRGNLPPYNGTNFNARVWVKVGSLDAAAAHGKLSTGYFNAPCGLIAVQPSVSSTAITGQLAVTAQAGDYKGVKAHSMGA